MVISGDNPRSNPIKAFNPPHLFPAIDIREGKAVRLIQGDYDREVDFDVRPVQAARQWRADGAKWLHVVDLDGAVNGRSSNLDHIEEIVEAVDIPVQLGGGLRDEAAIQAAFDVGVTRVVLGTKAALDPAFVDQMVAKHGDRIVISIDTRQGYLAVDGWTKMTETRAADALVDMEQRGVSTIIYTPIEVDGMEEGPKLDELKAAARATSIDIIYASGVGTLDHVRELAALELPNLTGIIVGTALFRGRFKIDEADRLLDAAFRSSALSHA
jgi:phosphoribosylformimino-5-aminoimidazole carboxamide ribotide isomerase